MKTIGEQVTSMRMELKSMVLRKGLRAAVFGTSKIAVRGPFDELRYFADQKRFQVSRRHFLPAGEAAFSRENIPA